jgi:hypothetical protein
MTTYPVETAHGLINDLTAIGSKNGGEIFLGPLMDDPHGYDYKRVVVDVTRTHWRQMRVQMASAGMYLAKTVSSTICPAAAICSPTRVFEDELSLDQFTRAHGA